MKNKKILNKPFRTPNGPKEMAVYVKNPKTGRINIVRFGSKDYRLNKQFINRKTSYCSRSGGIKSSKPNVLSPNYWSRKRWRCEKKKTFK